ncbi:AAA family ATPase [Flavobacterium sp. 3HN19-14]|uniref:AAA family ATPase n=1 Tax=Flavobacterium sp. 3HN19-14 TaxID=3448133 RepID=UPI003EE036F0
MSTYIPSSSLLQALHVAQMLNRPLLLTGEPGTGKTKFADYIREDANGRIQYSEIEKFYTKSTSVSQDLFYDFDSIAYFASRQLNEGKPISAFIYLKSLGLAICNALGAKGVSEILENSDYYRLLDNDVQRKAFVDAFISRVDENAENSIVLIDEIDKAPRDFPNDVLNEIDEGFKFKIKEINVEFALKEREKILVIITSNFEKNLPEPFLRRCVYFNIDFPNEVELLKIVCLKHFPDYSAEIKGISLAELSRETNNADLKQIIGRIDEIIKQRNNTGIIKKPSTSEIYWISFIVCAIMKPLTMLSSRQASIKTILLSARC